jgi:hypothetical protein
MCSTFALAEAYRQGVYHAEGVKHIVKRLSGKYLATPFLTTHIKINRPELTKFNRLLGGVLH